MRKRITKEERFLLLKKFSKYLNNKHKKLFKGQQKISEKEIFEFLDFEYNTKCLRISLKRGMIFVFGSKLILENNDREYYKGEEKYNLVKRIALTSLYIGNRNAIDDGKSLNNVLPEHPLYHFRKNHRKLRSFRDGIFFITTKSYLLTDSKEVKDFFEEVFNKIKI